MELSCALVCRRMAEACKSLEQLYINANLATSKAVLKGLNDAKLGSDSSGRPRTIHLRVSGRYRPL